MRQCTVCAHRLVLISILIVGLALDVLAAQQPPPNPTPARPAGQASAARARPALEIEVTSPQGTPLAGVSVRLTGTVEREGTTDEKGSLRFANLRAGTYRLRFDHETSISLERDLTIAASGRPAPVDVVLTEAPPKPEPPPPPPAAPAKPAEPERPVGEPRTLDVTAFAEKNFIGRSEPQKLSTVGCTGYQTTRILQLREPLADRVTADADETLYVVAGDATLRLGGTDRPLSPGALAVIPRGTTHTLSRRGRNPVIFISVVGGPPCSGF